LQEIYLKENLEKSLKNLETLLDAILKKDLVLLNLKIREMLKMLLKNVMGLAFWIIKLKLNGREVKEEEMEIVVVEDLKDVLIAERLGILLGTVALVEVMEEDRQEDHIIVVIQEIVIDPEIVLLVEGMIMMIVEERVVEIEMIMMSVEKEEAVLGEELKSLLVLLEDLQEKEKILLPVKIPIKISKYSLYDDSRSSI
jgi:hypothetical protein